MVEIRYLSNAPITEALVDIKVKLPSNFDIRNFKGLDYNFLLENFPEEEERKEFSHKFRFNKVEAIPEESSENTRGFFYKSADGKNIAQFKKDGFTFNRLKPYKNWSHIKKHTRKLWEIYSEISDPLKITHIGTRYLNHIKIPLPIKDLSEFMTAPPQVPEEMPNLFNGYLSRIRLKEPAEKINVNVTQSIEENTESNNVTLILDIDAYTNQINNPNDPFIWEKLENLRNMKNKVFFSSLTEKTINMFL